jgi:hypothetical protein
VDSALFLVQHQNKELAFELKSKKRSITDLRGQLQHQKQQSAVAEELLSVLDRSYNQVNYISSTYMHTYFTSSSCAMFDYSSSHISVVYHIASLTTIYLE